MARATARTAETHSKRRYKLKPYGRLSGASGVIAYAIGRDHIVVQFHSLETYLYTYKSATRLHTEAMKQRAIAGKGLSGYISQNTHEHYAKMLKVVGPAVVEG